MLDQSPTDAFFARAKDANVNISDVCARANVAQSTPSRWSKWEPRLSTLRRMENALSEIIAERTADQAQV